MYETLKVPTVPLYGQQHYPAVDQQLKIAGMLQKGGLIVIGETVATVHKEIPQRHCWDTIGYGIPCLTSKEDGLVVSISSIDNGETLHEFHLNSPAKYQVIDKHFHALCVSTFDVESPVQHHQHKEVNGRQGELKEACYGISFAHMKVAERFSQAVQQLIPDERLCSKQEVRESGRLLRAMSAISLVSTELEATDLPNPRPFRARLHSMEEAGALTSSGNFPSSEDQEKTVEDDEQALKILTDLQAFNITSSREELIEDVDGKHKQDKKISTKLASQDKDKKRKHSMEGSQKKKSVSTNIEEVKISFPTSVQHIGHVDSETPLHYLTKVVTGGGSAPETVLSSRIERHSWLKRTPSTPLRQRSHRYRRYNREAISAPTILITPASSKRRSSAPVKNIPPPPPPVTDFDSLIRSLQSLQTTTTQEEKEREKGIELSISLEENSWQATFHSAVAGLIRKKLHDEALYSKLLSFTQSGRHEMSEKPAHRTASVIIHDHGVVCL